MALCCCRCCQRSRRSRVRVRAVIRSDVYAFVFSRLHNRDDAEEVTRQTFVDTAAALARGAAPRAMRAWLFAVAQRRIADELRRRGRRGLSSSGRCHEDATVEPVSQARSKRLSPADRELLFLRFVAERTHREIGTIIGCNAAARGCASPGLHSACGTSSTRNETVTSPAARLPSPRRPRLIRQ